MYSQSSSQVAPTLSYTQTERGGSRCSGWEGIGVLKVSSHTAWHFINSAQVNKARRGFNAHRLEQRTRRQPEVSWKTVWFEPNQQTHQRLPPSLLLSERLVCLWKNVITATWKGPSICPLYGALHGFGLKCHKHCSASSIFHFLCHTNGNREKGERKRQI